MNRKRFIIIAIVIVILLGVAVYFLLPKHSNETKNTGGNKPTKTFVPQGETITPEKSSGQAPGSNILNGSGTTQNTPITPPKTQQFYEAIVQSDGVAPDSDGKVRFGITSVKQPLPGWFIVTIVKTGVEPNKVIFQQTNNPDNPLTIVAGPGTSFPPEFVSLPDAVRKAL